MKMDEDEPFCPNLVNVRSALQVHLQAGVVGPRTTRPDGLLDTSCKRSEPTSWKSLAHMTGLRRFIPHRPIWSGYSFGYVNDDESASACSVMGACQLMRAKAHGMAHRTTINDRVFLLGHMRDHSPRPHVPHTILGAVTMVGPQRTGRQPRSRTRSRSCSTASHSAMPVAGLTVKSISSPWQFPSRCAPETPAKLPPAPLA